MTTQTENVSIPAPNMQVAEFTLRAAFGSPYVQNAFPEKAKNQIKADQEAGSTAKKGKKREPKDFKKCYEQAAHKSKDGWYGMPAPGFRAAMVSACRVCGFHMTKAKLAVFVLADGIDPQDGSPLFRITKGEPRMVIHHVRNQSGVIDLRPRPMWDEWEAVVRIRFDADMFTLKDIANLVARVGMQVGLGEGRADSKDSTGMGWGHFEIVNDAKPARKRKQA